MAYEKLKSESYQNFGGRNRKASLYLTDVSDVLDLVNYDFSIVGSLTRRPGTAQYPPNSTSGYLLPGQVGGLYEFTRLSGISYLVVAAGLAVSYLQPAVGISLVQIKGTSLNNGIFTFQSFVDRMFAANGIDFFKWDGFTAYPFSLPPGVSLTATGVSTTPGLPTGVYTYYYGYLNERGYAGPAINGFSVSLTSPQGAILTGFTTPANYGITALIIYRTDTNLSVPVQIGTMAPNGLTFVDNGITLGTFIAPQYLWFTLSPQTTEIYNNQYFLGGFNTVTNYWPQQPNNLLSRAYFSDIGEPEGIGTTNWIEFRTNDGDYLSCMKSYLGSLIAGKTRSVFSLQGTSPPFTVNQISDQYGILSPRAAVVYNQVMWFLDEKGICQFDGANIQIVSNKMEDVFKRMNVPVAKRLALMLHAKERNEIWCSIPVDGSTYNNLTVVYDYVANGWTQFEGFSPQSAIDAYTVFPTRTVLIGEHAGIVSYIGYSILTDIANGQNSVTTMVQFRFESTEYGNATTKLFRRLWVDISPVLGVTYGMQANYYADKGLSTVVYSATFAQGIFQTRSEIGIAAKSLSVQLINSDQSPMTLNGYVYAFRYQRDV